MNLSIMAKVAAQTGIMPMALVAVEQYFPKGQRIVSDDLAYRMLPFGARIFANILRPRWMRNWMVGLSEKSQRGIWGGLLCRKRYIDEKLTAASNQMEAVVNLGAGFDTRSYRLPTLSNLPIWEIDQRENIEAKEQRLRKIFGKVSNNVKLVSIDFDHEDLGSVLESHGYSLKKRTFFIWEAVTQYLTEQGVKATFEFLAKAAPGSRLTFTYVRKDFLQGKNLYGWESGYKRFVAGKIWLFGFDVDAVSGFLTHYGWRLIEDKGYDELASDYIKPSGRNLASTPVERMVYAEKI